MCGSHKYVIQFAVLVK